MNEMMKKGCTIKEWNPEIEMKPGDRVRLHWYGDRNLPQWLNGEYATLVSFTTRLKRNSTTRQCCWKVKPDLDSGYRYIDDSKHIWFLYRDGVWYRVFPKPESSNGGEQRIP